MNTITTIDQLDELVKAQEAADSTINAAMKQAQDALNQFDRAFMLDADEKIALLEEALAEISCLLWDHAERPVA